MKYVREPKSLQVQAIIPVSLFEEMEVARTEGGESRSRFIRDAIEACVVQGPGMDSGSLISELGEARHSPPVPGGDETSAEGQYRFIDGWVSGLELAMRVVRSRAEAPLAAPPPVHPHQRRGVESTDREDEE